MKLINCPICGKNPASTTLVYGNGVRLHIVACSGSTLLDALVEARVKNHKLLSTGKRNTKRDAVMAWNKIVREYKPTLTAAQEPQVNPEAVASKSGTPA